ncbi:hypothetical protein O3M35_010315 [Rhynocoris fuscipes]|uniref:Dynein regulatory complex protein 9 n=1 Tax=Rhynocoris fuscipes TaxID=488301 RepID=A0AAW1D5I8_9HEMI
MLCIERFQISFQVFNETLYSTTEKERQIEELLIEKEERDKIIAEERRREECAIKIQAWWRGIMVRWEFGQYEDIMKKKSKKIKLPKEKKGKKK